MSNQNQPLTREAVMKIAQAINRLHALNQQKLATPDSDAEKDSLGNYVASGLAAHAAEFINAWLCVSDEYQPLVSGFASLQMRAASIAKMRADMLAQAQQPKESSDSDPRNSKASGEMEAKKIIAPPEFKTKE